MELALMAISSVFSLIGLAGAIWILIEAFKVSLVEGLLCLCIPCYMLYFIIAKLEHPQKGIMVGMWLGGTVIGIALNAMATGGMPGGM